MGFVVDDERKKENIARYMKCSLMGEFKRKRDGGGWLTQDCTF